MGNNNQIFNNGQRCDLGTEEYAGISKQDVDDIFQRSYHDTTRKCIFCGGAPSYQLIAKVVEMNTEQLRKEGIVCKKCINEGKANPQLFALRELR